MRKVVCSNQVSANCKSISGIVKEKEKKQCLICI